MISVLAGTAKRSGGGSPSAASSDSSTRNDPSECIWSAERPAARLCSRSQAMRSSVARCEPGTYEKGPSSAPTSDRKNHALAVGWKVSEWNSVWGSRSADDDSERIVCTANVGSPAQDAA